MGRRRKWISRVKKAPRLVKGIDLLWKRRKELIVILGAIPITIVFSSIDVFRKLETPALDVHARLKHWPSDSEVAIVRITDDDYKTIFEGRSPLDAGKLEKIIDAIARGRPQAIGVDIDTSAPEFKAIKTAPEWPLTVWAREGVFSNRQGRYHLSDVLGGRQPTPNFGLVVLKLDSDGIVRRYTRLCNTNEGAAPSFPWAIMKELPGHRITELTESISESLIEFQGDPKQSYRIDLPASKVLEASDGAGWRSNSPIRDKIVLLGGDYNAEDEHETPLGWMLGVEVLAHILETELQGGGTRPPSRFLMIFLASFDGLILLILVQNRRLIIALMLAAILVPLLALLSSYIAFRSLAQWAYFASILVVILGYQLYERAKDQHKKTMQVVN